MQLRHCAMPLLQHNNRLGCQQRPALTVHVPRIQRALAAGRMCGDARCAAAAAGAAPLGGGDTSGTQPSASGGSNGGGVAGGVAAVLAGVPLLGPAAGAFAAYAQRVSGLSARFVPMVALFFVLSCANTLLDSLKDTLIVTAPGGGASVLPFLSVWAVLPCSLGFLIAYSAAAAHMSRGALFNAVIAGFSIFFAAFAALLMPNTDTLHLHTVADSLAKVRPYGQAGGGRGGRPFQSLLPAGKAARQ